MPKLELVCCMGAGYEGVALEAVRARGIAVANGAGTNDDCVADHAFGLLIGIVRGIRTLDRQCREGVWREEIPQPPNVSGKKLGILGLGTIGQKIAKRAAGFDMEVGYHNRKPREGVAAPLFRQPEGAGRMGRRAGGRHAGRRRHAAPGQRRSPRCARPAGLPGQHLARQRGRHRGAGGRTARRIASPVRGSTSTRANPSGPSR